MTYRLIKTSTSLKNFMKIFKQAKKLEHVMKTRAENFQKRSVNNKSSWSVTQAVSSTHVDANEHQERSPHNFWEMA